MSKISFRLPTLKQWVAIVLIGSFALFILILIIGFLVPENTLERLSKSNTTTSSQPEAIQNNATSAESQTSADTTSGNTNTNDPTPTSPTSTDQTNNQSNSTSSGTSTPSTGAGTTPSGGSPSIAPNLTFSASPSSITNGSSAVLSWSINANATQPVTCSASGGWSGAKNTSGSQSVAPSSTTTYTLVCTNAAGSSGSKSVNIAVTAPPVSCNAGGTCTSADVAQHATTADCWMGVTGTGYNKVYVISSSFNTSHRNQTGKNAASTTRTCGKVVSINTLKGYAGDHQNGSTIGGNNFDAWLSSFYFANYQ